MTTTLALALGAFQLVSATAAKADSTVTCKNPIVAVNTGVGATSSSLPRFTIQCLGGSSAGNITYFAYEISVNPSLAALLMQTFQTWVLQDGSGSITIQSNLDDVSGPAWGCGYDNCRIIDYLQTN